MRTLLLFGLIIFCGCAAMKTAPGIGYFDTEPYIKPHQVNFNQDLHIIVDKDVRDTVTVSGADLKSMTVTEFKGSFLNSLKKSFSSSFNSVNNANEVSSTGTTIIVYRVVPSWHKKGATTTVSGSGAHVYSITNFEIASLIKYDVAVFVNGEKQAIISREVMSDMSTTQRKGMADVFKDGVKKMSEDLYVETKKLVIPK